MPAQLGYAANMSMLKEDIAQAGALARLEGDRSITGEFMRLNSPWQERYELAAGAVTTTPTLSNLCRLRHRQTPSLTTASRNSTI
jgi:hypothetical protein